MPARAMDQQRHYTATAHTINRRPTREANHWINIMHSRSDVFCFHGLQHPLLALFKRQHLARCCIQDLVPRVMPHSQTAENTQLVLRSDLPCSYGRPLCLISICLEMIDYLRDVSWNSLINNCTSHVRSTQSRPSFGFGAL